MATRITWHKYKLGCVGEISQAEGKLNIHDPPWFITPKTGAPAQVHHKNSSGREKTSTPLKFYMFIRVRRGVTT